MLLQQDGGSGAWFGPGTLKYSRQLPSQPAHFRKTGSREHRWRQHTRSKNHFQAISEKLRNGPYTVRENIIISAWGNSPMEWRERSLLVVSSDEVLVTRMEVCGSKIWIPVRSTPLQTSTVSSSGLTRSGCSPSGESWILNRWWPLLFFPLHGDYRISIKIFGLGSNLQQFFFFFQKPTVAQMTIWAQFVILLLSFALILMHLFSF